LIANPIYIGVKFGRRRKESVRVRLGALKLVATIGVAGYLPEYLTSHYRIQQSSRHEWGCDNACLFVHIISWQFLEKKSVKVTGTQPVSV